MTFGGADTADGASGDQGPVTSVAMDGEIDLGSVAVIAGGIVLNGGAVALAITTTGDRVRFNGAVELQSDV